MEREPTAFELKVYDAVRMIPRGKVSTYALVAKAIGCRSNQAIGQALKRNPFAPEMPCHRVISTTLRIGGFSGQREGAEIDRKRGLLVKEGVKVESSDRISTDCLFDFD
jgi:methylated-DNA-[protein]-cysteine S-methyltransferase